MIQEETIRTYLPAHVAAWNKTPAESIRRHYRRQDGTSVFKSNREMLVVEWLSHRWKIQIGETVLEGALVGFEHNRVQDDDPLFEIEVTDVNGLPMFIRAHFARFEMVSTLDLQ